MRLPRRTFLYLAAGTVASPAVLRSGWTAQPYPSRPVRIIVGFPAGGGADIVARLIGQWLSERLGQPFIVDNRPGAASNIAAETVVRATADGYTLLFVTSTSAINATLYDNLTFNLVSDLAPIAGLTRDYLVMEVNPFLPVKTVPEFIAYAKANPGKINYASAGNGSGPHVAGELFKMMTGVDMRHVPYRGSAPALVDLLGGQVQAMFDLTASSIGYVKAGKLRPLAVTSTMRLDALPGVPSLSEFVPGYESSNFRGLCGPKNTPAEIVGRLNKEINAGLADPKIKARLEDLGAVLLPMSPGEFGKLIADEVEKWGKVIRTAGIKVE